MPPKALNSVVSRVKPTVRRVWPRTGSATDDTPDAPPRPHVAFVIDALHGASGGAERVLVDTANGLFRRGYEVSVLTYQERNGPPFYPLDYGIRRMDGRRRHSRRRQGVALRALQSATRRRPLVGVAVWIAQYGPKTWRYRKLLRVARPDVAVGFMPSAFPYLVLASTFTGVKTVASMHNVPDRELGGDPTRWDQNPVDIAVRRRSLTRADVVTVLLPSFVEQLPEGARDHTLVVSNMIYQHPGRPADVTTSPYRNRILAVGRFSYAKDHATLVRAWAELEAEFPAWYVEIVGRGPLKRELRRLINELDLERLTLVPPTTEIEALYTASKYLVMPSLHEGFGLVTGEALACGLPVIGFADCEGTNEIVVHGHNGLLVDPGDSRPAALANAMRTLIVDAGLRERLGKRAPESIEQFDPEAVLDDWEKAVNDAWNR